jgi:pyrimidine-nucleoside phosphorylase
VTTRGSDVVPSQLIRRKRDGETLDPAELDWLLRGFLDGSVADYQMAAFLMATHFRGLGPGELEALVSAILESGERVRFDGIRPVDKHSTGGVGDTVSIVLAPLVASLGVPVPMMSGRGLGHSGGTVDKLEAIPGMRLDLSLAEFRSQVQELGVALVGQTGELAPLDGKLYALRDVTATVECVPLIAASIMSKKIAEGIGGLVLDVKVGNGAFLPDEDRALDLARTMIEIGTREGLDVVALLTAMDRPLGRAIGNALEVAEAVEVLRGAGPADLREVTVALAAEMLVMGAAAPGVERGRAMAEEALDDGRGLDMFRRVLEAQGGDPAVADDPKRLPAAPVRRPVPSTRSGRVVAMDTRAIGDAAVALGAGRTTLGGDIDPRVGFVMTVAPGDAVEAGGVLAEVHAADRASATAAANALNAAIHIGTGEPVTRPLISHRVTAARVERLGA